MLEFHKYLMRYGEFGVQAIVENIERNEGIKNQSMVPLETRWNNVMRRAAYEQIGMAA